MPDTALRLKSPWDWGGRTVQIYICVSLRSNRRWARKKMCEKRAVSERKGKVGDRRSTEAKGTKEAMWLSILKIGVKWYKTMVEMYIGFVT